MKTLLLVTFLCLPCTAQDDIQQVINLTAESAVRELVQRYGDSITLFRIGVFDHEHRATASDAMLTYRTFENYLTDQLVIAMMANKRRVPLEIVERSSLEKVLQELTFSMSDLVDQERSLQVGKLLNANILITGHYQIFDDHILLTTKLIHVESGTLLKAMAREIKTDKKIRHLLGYTTASAMIRPPVNKDRQARSGPRFFGGGVSFYFSRREKAPRSDNFASTFDVSFGYKKLTTSVGYSFFRSGQDLSSSHYLLGGASLKLFPFLKVGYMAGFPLAREESVAGTVSFHRRTAHYIKWTPLEFDFMDLTLVYTVIPELAYGFGNAAEPAKFWGVGVSLH